VIAVAALVLIVAETVRARRRTAVLDAAGAAEVWPCVVAQGPPTARTAVRATAQSDGVTAGAAARLAAACDRLASTRSDRLHAAVVVGAPPPVAFARLLRREIDDIAHHDDRAALVRSARAGRWLLLAPLTPIALGAATGAVAVAIAIVAVLAWSAAAAWIDAARPRRIALCAPTAHLGAPSASARA
jgi:hypothetical protein